MTNHTYGMILFRWDGTTNYDAIQILVIKRRCSYPFGDFVNGKYDPLQADFETTIKHRLSLMTAEEKSFIDSCDFALMYYKYWLVNPEKNLLSYEDLADYNARSKKFHSTFLAGDNGARLRTWLNSTSNIKYFDLIEFPKGRVQSSKDAPETPLATAKRETREETNIHDGMYDVISPCNPISHRFTGTDDHRNYNRTYFLGRMHANARVCSNVSHKQRHQRLEVDEIKWYSLRTLEEEAPIYGAIYQRVRSYCMEQKLCEVA